ncbi:MAG: polysaccharide lyase family 8 super-sandwich domain-containing protein [Candidatus Hodarchaeota archaeon]
MSEEEKVDFNILADKYEQALWGTPDKTAADNIAANLVSSSDGYYFNNINYDDDSRAGWEPRLHLLNLLTMTKKYGKDLIASDDDVRETVIRTLDYWINNDFRSLNWWYNEISTPQEIADIGIMLKNHLSNQQIGDIAKIIERGILAQGYKTLAWTGANLLDAVDTTIQYSFFAEIGYYLKKAVDYAENEIFISDGDTEGIKEDYTFYQHGAQQAITSYGAVYVSIIAKLAKFLNGTLFQFSSEKMDILVDFILYGQRYAIRGNNSNYLANGRSFSRKNGNSAVGIKNSVGTLISLEGTPKKGELQEFYDSFDDLNSSINDTKYFPYSHTLFDISPDYYMAVKGAYDGFINSELVNSENILSRNLGYGGVTTYQYTGSEYNDISALWDFSKLPGTTAYNETDQELRDYHGDSTGFQYRSVTTHSDGRSDGTKGGLYVDIENEEGLYSRQAYICYNGLMVCLGNSLSNSKNPNTKEVFTTIDQVYANNPTCNGSVIEGMIQIDNNSAISNGQFVYYNLEAVNLTAEVNNVTGNLYRNNLAQDQEYNADIFTLYYNYGTNPDNQSFAYAVLANPDDNAPLDADGLPIEKITNTNSIQAVEFTDGSAVIIFHEAGSFTTTTAAVISASAASIKFL